jgi:hypothetical protein
VWLAYIKIIFMRIPKEVREKLLLKLAEKDSTAGNVAYIVADNFDKLSSDVQGEIAFKDCRKR